MAKKKLGGHKFRLTTTAAMLRAARLEFDADDPRAKVLKRQEDALRKAANEFGERDKPGRAKIEWTKRADDLWPRERVPESKRRDEANKVFAQLEAERKLPTLEDKDLDPTAKLAAQRRLVLIYLKRLNDER